MRDDVMEQIQVNVSFNIQKCVSFALNIYMYFVVLSYSRTLQLRSWLILRCCEAIGKTVSSYCCCCSYTL